MVAWNLEDIPMEFGYLSIDVAGGWGLLHRESQTLIVYLMQCVTCSEDLQSIIIMLTEEA